jgi:hypothetical protein
VGVNSVNSGAVYLIPLKQLSMSDHSTILTYFEPAAADALSPLRHMEVI